MLQVVCDELSLQHSLHAMYKSSCGYYKKDELGRYHTTERTVFVIRDTFWRGTGPHERIETERHKAYRVFTSKHSRLLRPAGTPPILKECETKVIPTKEVHWVTKVPKDYNVVTSHFVAYGNEATMAYGYGKPVLIARAGTFAERNGQRTPGDMAGQQDAQADEGASSQPAQIGAKPAAEIAELGRSELLPATATSSGSPSGAEVALMAAENLGCVTYVETTKSATSLCRVEDAALVEPDN